eukprot:CAMPEP_0196571420 /NCGR_PEP_ID=MMETSP1081-20130531/1609_1 /TAXON_ID=36882 /ORGANISM="Pyramimonas amylifera, Strain CCMP720" /LENGTH=181 /DNA_ID=CAMNT_0041888367 /DNA_START=60 /DNA_END=606 /DNA_ORIENTATION=-
MKQKLKTPDKSVCRGTLQGTKTIAKDSKAKSKNLEGITSLQTPGGTPAKSPKAARVDPARPKEVVASSPAELSNTPKKAKSSAIDDIFASKKQEKKETAIKDKEEMKIAKKLEKQKQDLEEQMQIHPPGFESFSKNGREKMDDGLFVYSDKEMKKVLGKELQIALLIVGVATKQLLNKSTI